MDGIIGPSATVVFDSVGTIVDATGIHEKQPSTDTEWAAVGASAAALVESANLLMVGDRAVDKGEWATMSKALADAGMLVLKATQAKDADGNPRGRRDAQRLMRQLSSVSISASKRVKGSDPCTRMHMTQCAGCCVHSPLIAAIVGAAPSVVEAHGVSGKDAVFLQGLQGRAIIPLMYLGAKHMVTGYDHLLFLVGVIFFLYRLKDVLLYVSLFTIGHSVTLLAGVLGGIHANPYLIDAIIGFSVVYKAFENMDGFRRFFGFQPNTRIAVLVFGLFHGFGLATKLQEFALSPNGLVANIVSFNVGVEIGQGLALTGVLIALSYWRTRSGFMRHAFATNAVVMACGFLLVGYQLSGYFLAA